MKKAIISFLLAAALLVSMIGMASAGSQIWYLKDDASTVNEADHTMVKGSGVGTTYAPVGTTAIIWVADEVATTDVNFGTGTWTGVIDYTDQLVGGWLDSGETITITIGSLDLDTGTFTPKKSMTHAGDADGESATTISITPDPAFTVPNGDYLALKLVLDTGSVRVDCDGGGNSASYLISPSTDSNYIDIKPGSCPNPLNLKSKGVLPVAVLGTEDFDVTTIDPDTIRLSRESFRGEVVPLRWSYEDVATPYTGDDDCGCHELGGDGIIDLTLKFDNQELVTTLKLDKVAGETIPLILTGNLKEEYDGTSFEGQDCIWVLNKVKNG